MPPNPRQRRALSYETPSLSDEDVGLLYQIITRAEGKPEAHQTPFRALFTAYDEIIDEHAVDADPGHVCLHFLFKMGSKGIKGDTLFDKFENLLQHMGIVIELGDETETNEYYNQSSVYGGHSGTVTVDYNNGYYPQRDEDTAQPARRRRASFNSMYDVGDDPTQRSIANRPSSRSSLSRLEVGKPVFLESTPRPSPKRPAADIRQHDSPNRTQLIAQFLDVGRRLISRFDSLKPARDNAGDETQVNVGAQAKSAVHKDRSERLSRRQSRKSLSSSSSSEDDNDDDDRGDDESISFHGDESGPIEKPDVPPEMLYRPSLSDLLRDASTFNMYRERGIKRRLLTQWLKKAIQKRQGSANMEIVAVNRDRSTLLRQAFEQWRGIIQDKRQAVRTERFYEHLEQRAGRARDLFLVTKAFTHWAQVTSEEVARTSAARRRILSIKYFKAWREITAVNELKAQRFAMRKPFSTWRKRIQQIKENETTAAASHDRDLKNGVYWQWFWGFCDRRAPQWYEYRLKRRSLLCWLRSFRTNRERNHEIEIRNRRLAIGSAWQTLTQRSKTVAGAEQEAVSMQRHKLLTETFGEWKIQTCLAPAAYRVSHMVDKRVLRSAFTQWVQRAQMGKQAREMDRQRIMRNSWTEWNDQLRCQALSARIDERLKMETMYKWILAERFSLMQRIRDQRIKRDTFSTFVASIRGTYSRLLHHADIHEDYRSEELLRSKFSIWRDRLALQRQREYAAFEFYAPRLQQESVVAWRSKQQNVARLEARSKDARFYFLATKTIKQWHTATIQSAKRRRQESYAWFRRKVKMKIATRALDNWQSWAGHIAVLERQAFEFHRNKSLSIASGLFGLWHDQASKRVQDCHEAEMHYARQAAYGQLMRWTELYLKNRDLELQATDMYRVHILGQANASLRKLSLRIFQINSSSETADSLRERNTRKHGRGMFRHWIDKTRTKLEERDSFAPLVTPAKPGRSFDGTTGRSGRSLFDPWYSVETPFRLSEFATQSQGPDLGPGPSASPLATPNYMASPSKRAARARVLAQTSTTPATPLYTPFAGRVLRAEGMAAKSASNRRRNGRGSALGTSVRFVDEEPTSPSEGKRSGNRRTTS
ncbi:Sfi1 family protein [Aspergillus ruber CBS 135680]|uniref:Sfi1-domain-containing protein n=1 Tax=Aspergillus ruber (strain CBS 135680) TaxID=1388766 RepID=A0A017S5K6_ASPRC|nr:Sfi1-domain-containing protein [Aspergillus ruber CBS 135680]EYE92323.1 Sfi1-domain-containing protein [Aspergillus ruber CBS 135680]